MQDNNNDNAERDIIAEIDALTEPGPDAMRWSPENDTPASDEPDTAAGSGTEFDALFLGLGDGGMVSISAERADAELAELLGHQDVTHIEPVTGVRFWFIGTETYTGPLNMFASGTLAGLLHAVIAGNYAASDTDRDGARAMLASHGRAPVFGPCLITGVNPAGDGAAQLSDRFLDWFDPYIQRVHTALDTRLAGVLREHGIDPDAVTGIVIIDD